MVLVFDLGFYRSYLLAIGCVLQYAIPAEVLSRTQPPQSSRSKSMDGKGGRGGGGGGGAGNSTSGKKRATRSKTAAAQAQAQAQVQAQAAPAATTGANSGGKKNNAQTSGGNNKPKAAATAEKKKNAAQQSGNQQQQQQQQQQWSDQPKKKKKKRRLHAGAVAAKAAAKAAEAAEAAAAAAAAGTASLSASSPRRAAAGTTEGKPAGGMKQPSRGGQLVVTGKNVVSTANATPAPSQISSSAADNAVEKPKASSLKPAKKKQKVSQQQQQVNAPQTAQKAPKQQKQQHAQAQAPPAPAPVPGSIPKPKSKAKRKIEEVDTSSSSVQITTTTSAPKQNTLRQPAAHAQAQPPSTQPAAVADAPVAKKPKMVVLKRKPAQAPSEPPSVAAAGGSPAAALLESKQVVSAPAPKQDNIPKTINLAATATSTTIATGDGVTTVPDSAPRMNRATTPANTTAELLEDTDDEEKAVTLEAQASAASPENQNTSSVPSPVKSEQPRALESGTLVVTSVPAATPVPADVVEIDPTAIVQASPPLPLSPERSDFVNEWMVNSSSPTTELEFEADEAFFQPQPLLTSSATEDTNVLTLSPPDGHAEEVSPPALTDSKSIEAAASPASDSTHHPSLETTVKEESNEISEAPAFAKLSTDDRRQTGAEASSSTAIKSANTQNSREPIEEETKKHGPRTIPSLPPPVPAKQAPSMSGTTLSKQTEASHSAAVPRNPIVESRLRLPSKIEIPPPQPRQETNAWGASFGMAITPDRASASSSSSRSSHQLLSSQTSPALATSPLSSWFLSKGHANFVQHVSFPPRSAQHHRRRSLSPRKQLSANNTSTQAVQVTQEPADDDEDDDDRMGSSGNAFLESLTQRSNWRTWYGNVDKKDLLDPPLKHVPAEVHSAIGDSVRRLSESAVIASSGGADDQADDPESIERQRTKTRSIELLEAEIRAEKARARAFDQELLLMLQGGSALPSQT